MQHLDRDASPQPDVVGHVDATARARADRREQAVPAGEDAAGEIGDATDRHRVKVPAAPHANRGNPAPAAMTARGGCGVSLGRDGRHPGARRDPIVPGPRRRRRRDARRSNTRDGRDRRRSRCSWYSTSASCSLSNSDTTEPGGANRCPSTVESMSPEPDSIAGLVDDRQRRPRRQPHRRAARDTTA